METTNTPTNNALQTALAKHKEQTKLDSPAPHILVIGQSGTGKSRSIKNLPPTKTFVINTENKILPFTNYKDFEMNQASGFSFASQALEFLKVAQNDNTIKYIIFDSFTKHLEMMIAESRAQGGGFEIYNRYNAGIYKFLEDIKKVTNKIIILTGIDELMKEEQSNGSLKSKRVFSTEGKWLGKIEKEFAVVLFTDIKVTPGPKSEVSYNFLTNADGVTSAKSPEGMFPANIPNDLAVVVQAVEKYFKLS